MFNNWLNYFCYCPFQTNVFLQTEDLLRVEPEEGLEKVEDSIKTCQKFMKTYHDKKKDIARLFKEGVPVVEWDFNNQLIFARLNCYLERLTVVQVANNIP